MIEFNRGTKKFLRALMAFEKELEQKLTSIVENNIDNKSKVFNRLSNNNLKTTFKAFEDKKTQEFLDQEFENLSKNYPNLVKDYNMAKWIYKLINGRHAFNEFDILERLFERLNFEQKYQLEVIGYLLKEAADSFKELEEALTKDKEDEKTIDYNYFENLFERELTTLEATFGEDIVNQCLIKMKDRNYLNDLLDSIESYKVIDEYISETGEFLGNPDIERLYEALKLKQIRMTANQQKLIIQVVSDKYISQKIKEEEKEAIEQNKMPETQALQPSKKEIWYAKQIIKRYLKDDMPIKYISNEELPSIFNALSILNYSVVHITRIKDNIIKNNEFLEATELKTHFTLAKQKYLSVEDIELLDNIENLLSNPDSIINPLFNKIKVNFELVSETLLKAYQANDDDSVKLNEEAELMILAIIEMKEDIKSYYYSDYRLALSLSKKENK